MNKQKKRGISLVALVVTIIVLIILTGTVVATFMEGGIIDKAKEAVKKSDATTLREAYNVKYSEEKIKKEIGDEGKHYIDVLEETVKELGMEEEFKFTEYNTGKTLKTVEYIGENEYTKQVVADIVMENIEENEYIICNGYLTNIKIEDDIEADEFIITTEEDIKRQLGENIEIRYAVAGIISTGAEIYDENDNKIATILVIGDIDGNGWIDGIDVGHLNGAILLSHNQDLNEYKDNIHCFDVDGNGKIDNKDTQMLNAYSLEYDPQNLPSQKRAIGKEPIFEK